MALPLPSLHIRRYSQETISHRHGDIWQVVFGSRGALELRVDGTQGRLMRGQSVLIPPGSQHSFSGGPDNQQVILELPDSAPWRPDAGSLWQPFPASADALLQWIQAYPLPAHQHVTVARLLLSQISQGGDGNAMVHQLDAFLVGRLHLPLSVADMASACAVSVSTLQRRLRERHGVSPMAYLTGRRMEQARELLIQTRLPIGEIALQTGYESHSAFSNAFRQHFGESPGQLRQRMAGSHVPKALSSMNGST